MMGGVTFSNDDALSEATFFSAESDREGRVGPREGGTNSPIPTVPYSTVDLDLRNSRQCSVLYCRREVLCAEQMRKTKCQSS